ncbi:hypothetical protein EIP91_003020 [Steccherinum ochraceum]|uniref:Ubinuclein middle domain-containing protein n=1 Tax=Steccherinum ochraceum TaxID=92696 RepID=A0A4R0RRS5_9APHY|nr:hypothetical protein EIP91_003020 [Steccherinum ochraceum]
MDSDVDMHSGAGGPSAAQSSSQTSASPPHHSPIVVDDSDDSSHPAPPRPSSPLPASPSTSADRPNGASSSTAPPPAPAPKKRRAKLAVVDYPGSGQEGRQDDASALRPPNSNPPASSSSANAPKPKSTKPRSPSPSPPPPPAPPLQTVRLEIRLGGQENYAVDIAALSKDTGQRPATPVPVLKRSGDSSDDSHSEGDDEGEEKPEPKKKGKKQFRARRFLCLSLPCMPLVPTPFSLGPLDNKTRLCPLLNISSDLLQVVDGRVEQQFVRELEAPDAVRVLQSGIDTPDIIITFTSESVSSPHLLNTGHSHLRTETLSSFHTSTTPSTFCDLAESRTTTEIAFPSSLSGIPLRTDFCRRNHASEYYDLTDPFIDDSELTKDERTFFAETKQQGFYVSSGQVALQHNAAPSKKPKSRKVNILAPAASVSAALATLPASLAPLSLNGASSGTSPHAASHPASPRKVTLLKEEGTRDAPIALLSDDDKDKTPSVLKRKASGDGDVEMVNGTGGASVASASGSTATSKKKRKIEIRPFHPDLQAMIDQLKKAIAAEPFDQKGKFPPSLKPILAQVALKAVVLGEYDDNFFNLMPTLFPYNKFTMTKLIKRTIWRDHMNLLIDRQEACLKELQKLATEGFQKAKEEHERSVVLWEKRHQAKPDAADAAQPGAASTEGTPVPSDTQQTPNAGTTSLPAQDGGHDSGHEDDGAPGGPKSSKDAHPPTKRYKLTEQMKALIWQLVCLSNECCRIENEKNTLEANHQTVSEQGFRKVLYQKIVLAFPDGWLSSGQISRDVSVMKKKYEKDAMEE